LAPEHGPVSLRHIDELVIPTAALEIVTTRCLPGASKPPIRIDQQGIDLGTFKVKGVA
jgi:hypothetical protein